jgi:Organic solute transporter Ostalpha
MKVLHVVVTVGLCAAVTVLGMQLHALQRTVASETAQIGALQQQVANQHQNQQDLNQRVDQEHSLTLYQMAGTFTLLTCLVTAFHITQHLSNFHEPVVQRKIIAILWMSPIYSITSFLSLVFPAADGYLAVIKDLYESYVIYTFLSFLIAVLGRGNRGTAVQVLACHADHLKPPTRCFKSFYFPPPETSATAMASAVLMECQILAMQFVLVRPVTSILSFVAEALVDNGDSGNVNDDNSNNNSYAYFTSPNFYIAMLTNVSVFFAFNGLIKFYHVVRDDLEWCQPFNKFVSVKSIVFVTFWQGLLISIIVNFHYSAGGGTNGATVPGTALVTSPMAPPPTHAVMTTLAPVVSPSATKAAAAPPAPVSRPTPAPTSIESATIDLTKQHNNSTRHRFLSGNTTTTTSDNNTGTNDDDDKSSHERAAQIQNFLICLEMLFFSIAHWCVFPAEEWKPDYRPPQHYAKPGIGLKDFASDISYIYSSSRNRHHSSNLGNSSQSNSGDENDVSENAVVVEFADGEANDPDDDALHHDSIT